MLRIFIRKSRRRAVRANLQSTISNLESRMPNGRGGAQEFVAAGGEERDARRPGSTSYRGLVSPVDYSRPVPFSFPPRPRRPAKSFATANFAAANGSRTYRGPRSSHAQTMSSTAPVLSPPNLKRSAWAT